MFKYRSSGVYIKEINFTQRSIAGVSTSIAGFVGQTEKGPASATLVRSWSDFQTHYGSFIDTAMSYLPLAVKGFFENGGTRAYIARVGVSASGLPISAASYIGDANLSKSSWTGLQALSAIDEVSILCVPDEAHPTLFDAPGRDSLRGEIIMQCESLRDRFAILQLGRDEADAANINPLYDTSFAAIYYPWISVLNPFSNSAQWVPPVGHIAGIYARTDGDRGVHKSPANAVIRGLVKSVNLSHQGFLRYDVSRVEQSILNPRGVNVLRDFSAYNRGVRVWGARTLSTDSQWRYIAVRRFCLYLEESISKGTQWVVFEPNNANLWQLVIQSVNDFLYKSWKAGALLGSKPDQAYFVRCDRSTMSADDIRHGRLVCLVGVALTKPAEFVTFKIEQKTNES